jgi:4-hydroxybenzoate polyprenyltransferase
MFDNIFDIKNDRRLGIYLYRAGFGFWLCYIFLGASFMQPYVAYRLHCAVLCGFLMVSGLTASMTYDYYHHPAEFEKRKKWLIIAYVAVAAAVYFLVLREPPLF